MSYFCNARVYIIIPTSSITEEMVNNTKMNFYSDSNTLKTSDDGTLTLFKVKTPVSSVFNGYAWYNCDGIKDKLNEGDWNADT